MAEIRPPVSIAYKIFRIEDIRKLSDLFLEQANKLGLNKSFKVQFADDHIAQVKDDISIFSDDKVIDRELEKIEIVIGSSDQQHYAKLVINHGKDEGSYLECSADDYTWAGGFEEQIMKQIKHIDSQICGKFQAFIGLLLVLALWITFTYALGKILHSTGITEWLYNLVTSKAAIRFIPDSYSTHSYLLVAFPSFYIAGYLVSKLDIIFPVIDLHIGKKRQRRYARLIGFGKWILTVLAAFLAPILAGLLI